MKKDLSNYEKWRHRAAEYYQEYHVLKPQYDAFVRGADASKAYFKDEIDKLEAKSKTLAGMIKEDGEYLNTLELLISKYEKVLNDIAHIGVVMDDESGQTFNCNPIQLAQEVLTEGNKILNEQGDKK